MNDALRSAAAIEESTLAELEKDWHEDIVSADKEITKLEETAATHEMLGLASATSANASDRWSQPDGARELHDLAQDSMQALLPLLKAAVGSSDEQNLLDERDLLLTRLEVLSSRIESRR